MRTYSNQQVTKRWAVLAIGLIVVVGAVIMQVSQLAAIGGRVANPDPKNPRSEQIFIYTLDHGQVKNDQLLVINNTDRKQTIALESVDGVVTDTGHYTCRQAVEEKKGSGAWVKLSKTSVTLPAGGQEKVDFRVTVPKNADVGEHNSCLTMQADEEASTDASGVRISMRQAIRMVTTVPGDLKRDLIIEEFAASLGTGTQNYNLTVANKGNVSADVDMKVRLTSLWGHEVAETGGEYPVIPNQHLAQQFATEHRPLFGGWYHVVPSIRYDTRLGVFGTESAATYETKQGDRVTLFLWPTSMGWLIMISIAVAIITLLSILIGRRRRNKNEQSKAVNHIVKDGETVQSIAQRAGVSWKVVVRMNKLAAPYVITQGDHLKVPRRNPKRYNKKK